MILIILIVSLSFSDSGANDGLNCPPGLRHGITSPLENTVYLKNVQTFIKKLEEPEILTKDIILCDRRDKVIICVHFFFNEPKPGDPSVASLVEKCTEMKVSTLEEGCRWISTDELYKSAQVNNLTKIFNKKEFISMNRGDFSLFTCYHSYTKKRTSTTLFVILSIFAVCIVILLVVGIFFDTTIKKWVRKLIPQRSDSPVEGDRLNVICKDRPRTTIETTSTV